MTERESRPPIDLFTGSESSGRGPLIEKGAPSRTSPEEDGGGKDYMEGPAYHIAWSRVIPREGQSRRR